MPTQHVQTKNEIASLLETRGIRPRKRLGQHFLIDGNLMRRLADSAELNTHDLVIEVGAGTGGLTDLLAARAGRVLAVELDRALADILEDRFRDASNVAVIRGDILEQKHRIMADAAEKIRQGPVTMEGTVKLVANLPYQVATPLLMNLLIDFPEVRRLCFAVQLEVGSRITAGPGTKAYGPLSILSQALCSVRVLAKLPARVFWPRPAVDSIMIRMDVGPPLLADRAEVVRFATLLRQTFDHRRKTLRSALAYAVDEEAHARVCGSLDATRRPESFTVDEWLDICRTATADSA
jgi:16S rRNA (adenine1518-N6/adenine1519-N6)-dimethyltransferase